MHHHETGKFDQGLARKLARARVATAPYVANLELAKADGYRIITPMMKDMGFHYLNPNITGFDVTKPHILVYTRRDGKYQLGALEWVFPKKPKQAPLKGAKYGSFPAACHYDDGTFSPASSEDDCKPTSPESGSPFVFWHPDLVTLHVWIWNPNPGRPLREHQPARAAVQRRLTRPVAAAISTVTAIAAATTCMTIRVPIEPASVPGSSGGSARASEIGAHSDSTSATAARIVNTRTGSRASRATIANTTPAAITPPAVDVTTARSWSGSNSGCGMSSTATATARRITFATTAATAATTVAPAICPSGISRCCATSRSQRARRRRPGQQHR